MAQQIARFDATFTALDIPSAMVIPVNAEEVALRVYRAQGPLTLSIFAVVDVPPPAGPPRPRRRAPLSSIGQDEPLPANYVKYISTQPFGSALTPTHIIEIAL